MEKYTLRSARMMRDIKIADLATALEITPTTWVNYESGRTKIPATLFLRFCKIVDINPLLFDLN